ncbi:hypothetical protein D3C78_1482540 [compost metagenome]
MAHGGEELAFGLVCRLGGLAGNVQRRGIFDMLGHIMQRTQPGVLALVASRHEGHMHVTSVNLQLRVTGSGRCLALE